MHKILIIDDEAANVRVLSMSLKLDGYEVLGALSGEEGLALFKTHAPQIVLADIKMPGMDGLEVLRRIKALNPETEVIIITGHGDIDSAIEAMQYGASDFINKPIKDEALSIALKRARDKLDIRRQLNAYTHDLENMVEIATEEVKHKSNFQAKLITSSHDGIVATDEDWKIIIFNPEAERILGYSRIEVLRKTDIRDLLSTEIKTMLCTESDSEALRPDLPWMETSVSAKDGTDVPVRFAWKVLSEKDKMVGSVAFFQDLREIKRLQKELIRAERLAAIGQTVAGMAHCIKNILHGFKGGSYIVELGLDRNDMHKLKTGWQMIQRNISRTSELVMDLLFYSKERAPEYQDCFPNDIVAEVCELLKETAAEHDVRIKTDFDSSIGEVSMDPRTVQRALLNLMSNAIDACVFDEDIEKKHYVLLKTVAEADAFIRFEVKDNGMGMDDAVRQKLFSSFFSTKGAKGTGLGLLVTQKLIQEHQGSIQVDSRPGKGTTFIIRLPYKKSGPGATNKICDNK